MEVFNNTSTEVEYLLISATLNHSGTLAPGDTADEPDFDNQQNVTASFTAASGSNIFEVIIPQSTEGQTVTIGLSFG